MKENLTEIILNRLVLGILLGGLLLLTWNVVQPFVVPVVWAIILAYSTWPIVERMRRVFGGRRTLAAIAMTLLLSAAFVLPALWLVLMLRGELARAYSAIVSLLADGPLRLPDFVIAIPWVGEWLQQWLDQIARDPGRVRAQLPHWVEARADELLRLVGGIGRNAAKLGFALVTVFFLYRDGEHVLSQAQHVLRRFLGRRVDAYLLAVGAMTKAVVWGLVATALGQGVVAGVGYWWFGIEALVAMIPFGTPFVWGGVGAWLLASGRWFDGIGLLLWGTLVVSWVDNLVRPLVISNATRIPFLLVMFGVLGGLAAFGLVGLFVGPVILAVVMAVWREWIEESGKGRPG
jgi:predicted PurR-regulated permease PerM